MSFFYFQFQTTERYKRNFYIQSKLYYRNYGTVIHIRRNCRNYGRNPLRPVVISRQEPAADWRPAGRVQRQSGDARGALGREPAGVCVVGMANAKNALSLCVCLGILGEGQSSSPGNAFGRNEDSLVLRHSVAGWGL